MTTNAPKPPPEDDLPCAVFVEMVTDYLEGSIPDDLRARLEEHLATCPGCTSVLDQIDRLIRLAGRVTEDDVEALPTEQRAEILSAFRAAHRID